MPHPDPETLATRAMGWPATPDEGVADVEAHLATCPSCQSELDELRAVARTAEATTPDDTPTAPPPHVWHRVAHELGVDPSTSVAPADSRPPATVQPWTRGVPAQRRQPQKPPRRLPQWVLAAAATAVGVLVGMGITLGVTGGGGGEPPVVAEARLSALPGQPTAAGLEGKAQVVGTGRARQLHVTVAALPDREGYYQVWLFHRTTDRVVSVGVLVAEQGTFRIPPGLDLGVYPVVDVSLEPLDGNPAHSQVSVTRGSLRS